MKAVFKSGMSRTYVVSYKVGDMYGTSSLKAGCAVMPGKIRKFTFGSSNYQEVSPRTLTLKNSL